jgi:phage gp36-like protein
MTAYASASDLIERYDSNTIGDLASDSGESIPEDQLVNSVKVSQALEDASGRVEAAVFTGDQYDADDLNGLEGNAQALLQRIVCELAFVFLMERRSHRVGDERLQAAKESTEKYLDEIKNGDRIFGIPAHLAASVVDIDGPDTVDYTNMNLIPDRTNNFYPGRSTRLPLGR